MKKMNQQQKMESREQCRYNVSENNRSILWIEKLLRVSIQDHRKFAVWRILAPYLTNVRKLSYKESFNIIKQWLLKCNELKRLDFDSDQRIKEGLRGAARGYYPIGRSKLKEELPAFYDYIQSL